MVQIAEAPILEHYVTEPPREDAAGTWLARLTLQEATPIRTILTQLNDYVERKKDPDALLTGYILGDGDLHQGTTIVFGRDPYPVNPDDPTDTYRTLSGKEYNHFIEPFAGKYATKGWLPQVQAGWFHGIIGRRPGYGNFVPYSVEEAASIVPNLGSVSLLPCHFFSTRYHDPNLRWDEPALVTFGKLKDIRVVDALAQGMKQKRFPLYTASQTYAYKAIADSPDRPATRTR